MTTHVIAVALLVILAHLAGAQDHLSPDVNAFADPDSQLLKCRQEASYWVPYCGDLAAASLRKYDTGFATRMWEMAADKSREIWQRHWAEQELAAIDPASRQWSEVVPGLIAAHDFASDPALSFKQFRHWSRPVRILAELKEQFTGLNDRPMRGRAFPDNGLRFAP